MCFPFEILTTKLIAPIIDEIPVAGKNYRIDRKIMDDTISRLISSIEILFNETKYRGGNGSKSYTLRSRERCTGTNYRANCSITKILQL